MSWELKRTTQCAHCPWRVDVDPHDIPNGYSVEKHQALEGTIARPETAVCQIGAGSMKVMACHETEDAHCLGWLMNQLGPGNNIALRMQVRSCSNIGQVHLIGEQHERFEDTLPED